MLFLLASSNTVYGETFDSVLQLLPQPGSARIRPGSKRVLSVGEFGAKGDGVTDDSQVTKFPQSVIFLLIYFCFLFWGFKTQFTNDDIVQWVL